MKRTIATPEGGRDENIPLDKQVEIQADWTAADVAREASPVFSRENAYLAKGWKTPFDLIDDILARGIDAVKADRDAIKALYPDQ